MNLEIWRQQVAEQRGLARDWARKQKLGNWKAKLVLMDLTFYVDGLGNCLVTPQELAETTELPLDMVSKQLQILEARGLISRPAPMTINLNFRGA